MNTNVELRALDGDFFANCDKTKEQYNQFINSIKNRIHGKQGSFSNIYLALLPDKRVLIHQKLNKTIGRGLIIDEEGNLAEGTKSKNLTEVIDKHYIGDGVIQQNQQTPINTIIEFSPTELYPEVMKKLEEKYDIKRISFKI